MLVLGSGFPGEFPQPLCSLDQLEFSTRIHGTQMLHEVLYQGVVFFRRRIMGRFNEIGTEILFFKFFVVGHQNEYQ